MPKKAEPKKLAVVATTSFVANINGVDVHFVPDTPYEIDKATFEKHPGLFQETDEWMKGRPVG